MTTKAEWKKQVKEIIGYYPDVAEKEMIKLIKKLLKAHTSTIIERVEGLKKVKPRIRDLQSEYFFKKGFNAALDQAIKEIRGI